MIGLVLAPLVAQATAPAFPPAGTYTYAASVAGANSGRATLTVQNTNGQVVIAENTSGTFNGSAATAKATLTLAPDLSLSGYTAGYSVGGKSLQSSIVMQGAIANVTGANGTMSPMNLVADAHHFIVIDPGLIAGFFAVPAQMSAWKNAPVIAIASSFGQSVPLTVGTTTPPSARPAGVPAADAYLSLNGPLTVNIWYDPAGLVVDEIDVPSQSATVTRVKS